MMSDIFGHFGRLGIASMQGKATKRILNGWKSRSRNIIIFIL